MGAYKLAEYSNFSLQKSSDYNEDWLQDFLFEDPSRLGLGDLRAIERERRQSSGGRLDMLLKDDDNDTLYEVEIMLGKTDESHIIRTIEYWDLERRKNPNYNHVAVIVAEEITNRFFNVISLLSNNIPIIAIQLNALTVNNQLIMNFVKVLDLFCIQDLNDIDNGPKEVVTREFWNRKAKKESMQAFDQLMKLIETKGIDTKPTYNKGHIALSSKRNNFCWPHPRKNRNYCLTRFKVGKENIAEVESILLETGLEYKQNRKGNGVSINLTTSQLKEHSEALFQLAKIAYDFCSKYD